MPSTDRKLHCKYDIKLYKFIAFSMFFVYEIFCLFFWLKFLRFSVICCACHTFLMFGSKVLSVVEQAQWLQIPSSACVLCQFLLITEAHECLATSDSIWLQATKWFRKSSIFPGLRDRCLRFLWLCPHPNTTCHQCYQALAITFSPTTSSALGVHKAMYSCSIPWTCEYRCPRVPENR